MKSLWFLCLGSLNVPARLMRRSKHSLIAQNTPLFHGALEREFRPWEPELPEVRYRPRDTRRNVQEFRRSEGVRWIPEAPRSGEFYLPEPNSEVPVLMEAVPLEPGTTTPNAPEAFSNPNAADSESLPRLRADRIPLEDTSAKNAVSPASGTRGTAKTEALSPSKSSQIRSVRGIQTFHRPN